MIKEFETWLKQYEPTDNGGGNFHTHKRYKIDVGRFIEYFDIDDVKKIETISKDEWREFCQSFPNLKASSVNAMIRSIFSFVNYLKSDDIIEFEKITSTKMAQTKTRFLKTPKKVHIIITDAEFVSMMKVSDSQNKAMLAVMRYCALREAEMVALKIDDFDFDYNVILVHGKGDKERQVGMPEVVVKYVKEYITSRTYSGEWFLYGKQGKGAGDSIDPQQVNARIKSIATKAGISEERVEKITAHKFRATALTSIAKEYDLETARQAAGHSNLETTRIYVEGDASSRMKKQRTVSMNEIDE